MVIQHNFTNKHGRMILHLSTTCPSHLGALGRMSLHLSPTLVSHSGCLGPHDFTLVSHTCLPHLSPTLVSHTCLPHLSPTLVSHSGCLGPHEFALISHLFPTCLRLSLALPLGHSRCNTDHFRYAKIMEPQNCIHTRPVGDWTWLIFSPLILAGQLPILVSC